MPSNAPYYHALCQPVIRYDIVHGFNSGQKTFPNARSPRRCRHVFNLSIPPLSFVTLSWSVDPVPYK